VRFFERFLHVFACYFYDQPIATFTDVHAALAFVKNRTRCEATRQLHRLNGHPHPPGRISCKRVEHAQAPEKLIQLAKEVLVGRS
jgi:hypothetical protein